jgi:hypothetical protein
MDPKTIKQRKMKKKNYLKNRLCIMVVAYVFTLITTKAYSADIVAATAGGSWSSTTTWVGGAVPTAADNVFINGTTTVTVDVNATIVDLHLSNSTGTRLAIGAGFTVQLTGKIRAFSGAAPGTNSNTPSTNVITTSAGAKLQFVGATRTLQASLEWGANPRNYVVDFALDAGATGTISNSFKGGDITISSGTILANNDLRADYNSDNTGTITVKNGATLRMGGNISRGGSPTATSQIASFTLEAGGVLEYAGATVGYIDAQTITLNGLVTYTNALAQTLVNKPTGLADGVVPNVYTDLTLQTSAKTLSSNTTVNGILSMRTSTPTMTNPGIPSIVLNSFALTYGPNATLQYRGIGTPVPAQTTADTEWPAGGSSLSLPSNVDIFNSSNVTLNSNKSITGNLKLSGGAGVSAKVLLNASKLSVSTISIPNADGNKYIVTDGGGILYLPNVGTTEVLFPVGPSDTKYHPAFITNIGTIDQFGVNVSTAPPACANPLHSPEAFWDISESISGGSDCTLKLDFTGASLPSGTLFAPANAKIAHCDGSTTNFSGGSVVGNVVTLAGVTSFSPFYVTSDPVVLPLNLVSFTATKTNTNTKLNWETTNEEGINNYEVEQSTNGVSFAKVGTVVANNTRNTNRYSYSTNNVATNVYYRLKIASNNGRAEYSNVLLIKANTKEITIYPNPAQHTVNLTGLQANATIVIVNTYGQVVKQLTATSTTARIDITSLPTGVYNVKIKTQNDTEYSKTFVKK